MMRKTGARIPVLIGAAALALGLLLLWRGAVWPVQADPGTPAASTRYVAPHGADSGNDCATEMARETYGFGTGRFMHTDGDGVTYDLTQMLDASGARLVDFSHEGQGPVPIDKISRALSLCP